MTIRGAIPTFTQLAPQIAEGIKKAAVSNPVLTKKVVDTFTALKELFTKNQGANLQAKQITNKTATTPLSFKNMSELDRAIQTATNKAVFLEKQATRPNAHMSVASEAVAAKGNLRELQAIKSYYRDELEKQTLDLSTDKQLDPESLLKVVTLAVQSGIIHTSDNLQELPGSFGMAKMLTLRDQENHEFRVLVEANDKGGLTIRKILRELGAGAEGIVSLTEQLENKREKEVIKEPKTGDDPQEKTAVSGLRREAILTAKAKGEVGLKVRTLMGGGEVAVANLRTGGDLSKAQTARRAAVLLLDLPPSEVSQSHGEKWQLTNEKLQEKVDELATAVKGQATGKPVGDLLNEFGGDIGQQLLSKETFQKFDSATSRFGWKQLLEKNNDNEELATNELKELLTKSVEEAVQNLGKHHETFNHEELFTTLVNEIATSHKNGIIHRDIKPPNLLHDRDGKIGSKPTLADFGMAIDLAEIKKKSNVFEECNFPVGNAGDRQNVYNALKQTPIKDAAIANRLIDAGILKSNGKIADQSKLDKLTEHLQFLREDQDAFVPAGTRYYTFAPYIEAASEYLARGGEENFQSYTNLLCALDKMAGAVTYYQLVTGQSPPVSVTGGKGSIRLSDADLSIIQENLQAAGEPQARINQIVTMLTPMRIDADALVKSTGPLPPFPG